MKSLICHTIRMCVLLISFSLSAYEADQYTNRLVPVKDSVEQLDAYVNRDLQQIVDEWTGPKNDYQFARRVYFKMGGIHWVDKMERWTMNSPLLERYPHKRYTSIYRGMPVWATRVNFFFGIGTSIYVNGVRVGSDKFGHFFSQGLKYYRRELQGWDLERVMARGAYAERWLFGYLTTGIYANADLVANYEGLQFYRSLSQDRIIGDKIAIIGWRGDQPFLQRPFTWRDHINDYWDEALNPSYVGRSIQTRLVPAIQKLCDEYWSNPGEFVPHNDTVLWNRYAKAGLRDSRHNRFDQVCGTTTDSAAKIAPHVTAD
jgi:hypothetical protein